MSFENDCRWCKHKFQFKFLYRTWDQIAKKIYDASVKCMNPVVGLTFLYDCRQWVVVANIRDGLDVNGSWYVKLVECRTATRKDTQCTYYFHDEVTDYAAFNLQWFQKAKKTMTSLDFNPEIIDIFGDGLKHHCCIRKIEHGSVTRLYLEETWSCKK